MTARRFPPPWAAEVTHEAEEDWANNGALIAQSRDQVMPKYLVEGRYTSDGLTGLAREGVSRRRVDIAKTIQSAVGKLEAFYFAFGDADFYIIFDAPDNISAAALSVVANQGGFVTSKITVLLTTDEMDQAVKKAMTIEYPRQANEIPNAPSPLPAAVVCLGVTVFAIALWAEGRRKDQTQ